MKENQNTARAEDYIGKLVSVIVDRPLHSKHPKYRWEYPLNYGYVPGTFSPDGEPIDAYIIGIDVPVRVFRGKCVAVIHRTNDGDDKLVVVPEGNRSLIEEEIRAVTHFQEQYFQSEIMRVDQELSLN